MAATGGGSGGGGGRHWLDAETPDFRGRMRRHYLPCKLASFFLPKYAPDSPEAQRFIARLEDDAFRGTNSKAEYVKKISDKVVTVLRNKSGELQRRAQLNSQLQQANEAHALHGGNSSVMPEAVMVASPRPTSQSMTPQTSGLVPNQHMLHTCTSNRQIEVEKKHHGQDHYPNLSGFQRRAQLNSQLQQANEAQALHGGNSSVMPEAVMVASPRPTSQSMTPQTSGLVPNQHMLHTCTSNRQIEVEKKHHGQDHYPNLGGFQRRAQLNSQLQQANEAQALHGGNSSVMPEAVMVASPRPTSQSMTPQTSGLVPNQHMLHPCTSNMQIEVEKKHHGQDHCSNFQTMGITRAGPSVQSGPWPMQSGASQSESQYMARQLQATNFVGCSSTSGSKPVIWPNSQQNHLTGQNNSAIGGVRQPQMTRLNEILRANQQEMGTQRYQMLGAQQADVSKMQPGQHRRWNNHQDARQTGLFYPPFKACEPEPMTPPVQQIPGAQQNTLLYQNSQIPATMGSAREYDLKEEIFCKVKSWKDAYLPQFLELDHRVVLPTLTEEQVSSLPEAKANQYKRKADFKKSIRRILNLMSLQKSEVHEGLKVDLPKYEKLIHHFLALLERNKACQPKMNCEEQNKVIDLTGNASSTSGGNKSRQQEQPADASILQSAQTTMARTSPPHQQSNVNHLLGIPSPPFSSPGSLQSWSSSMLESLSPSPVPNPVVAPASPCAPVPMISMDVNSINAFLMNGNAAAPPPPKANSSNQVTPTEPITPASPLQADIAAGHGEVQAQGGDRTPVTKRPIDRLMDAIRSSSPAELRRSANSIRSVLSISDFVPHGKIGTMLDCRSSLQQQGGSNTVNKMKRVFNNTASRSESLPLGSMDSSCMSFGCDASDSGSSSEVNIKRQKTQNARNEALLEEIKSVNNTLIDTVVSISDYCGMNAISPYDGGTTIKLSYSAVSLSPSLKSLFATSEMCLVLPVKLFVPADYPSSSPVLINDEGDEARRKNSSAISASADVAFRHALDGLPEPRSVEAMARAWDASVRKAVTRFAERQGGGTISSMLDGWKRCAAA